MNFLIMLDFDGTLVELAQRPHAIQVDPKVSSVLQSLKNAGHAVYIISGRIADDVKMHIAPAKIPVIGLHGLDWEGQERPLRPAIFDTIAAALSPLASQFPGFYFEDKELIIAFHFRQVEASQKSRVKDEVRRQITEHLSQIDPQGLTVMEGHEVIEVKPNSTSKATVAKHLEAKHSSHVPVFIGDDLPDEEAMAALGQGAITIRVSKTPVQSQALGRLESPAQVLAFLQSLL